MNKRLCFACGASLHSRLMQWQRGNSKREQLAQVLKERSISKKNSVDKSGQNKR